jgi:hypothetical protein
LDERVVLIHPPPHGEVPFRHVGLGYLHATLLAAGLEVTTLDLSAEEALAGTDYYEQSILYLSESVGSVSDGLDPRVLMEVLHPELFDELLPLSRSIVARVDARLDEVARSGDVFLFSANIITYYFAARLAWLLRRLGKRTAVGGPSLRFAPVRDLLLRSGAFDAAVSGEGEPSLVRLVQGLRGGQLGRIPGVSWLDGDCVRSTPADSVSDLDALPYPWFDPKTIRDFIPILASRGCAARCSYCSEPFHWTRHRRRTPEAVLSEMDWAAARYGCDNFHFHDDMLNGNRAWFDALLDGLVARGGRYRWESFIGPSGLDRARLERMRASGCVLLKMGAQSFSPRTLRSMRRAPDVAELESAIVEAEKLGISMHYDMLICFPGESESDHRENMAMIEKIFARTQSVYFSLNPFYLAIGSDTHLNAAEFGIEPIAFDPSSLPGELAELVRACGPQPIGFRYDLPREVVRRRVREMGEILARHGRDYLYLGQDHVPDSSGGFRDAKGREGPEAVAGIWRELVRPWRQGEEHAGWLLENVRPVRGGEDGLVSYEFRSASSPPSALVSIKLMRRTDQAPCFARTRYFSVYYQADAGPDQADGHVALVRQVTSLLFENEARLAAAQRRRAT